MPPGGDRPLADRPRIVCGVTDDGVGDEVLATARALAGLLGGELHAFEVLEGGTGLYRALEPPPGGETEQVLAVTDPEGVLRSLADEQRADLVVVGRPSAGLVGSTLSGSVAHGLLKHGAWPVVVAPAGG